MFECGGWLGNGAAGSEPLERELQLAHAPAPSPASTMHNAATEHADPAVTAAAAGVAVAEEAAAAQVAAKTAAARQRHDMLRRLEELVGPPAVLRRVPKCGRGRGRARGRGRGRGKSGRGRGRGCASGATIAQKLQRLPVSW